MTDWKKLAAELVEKQRRERAQLEELLGITPPILEAKYIPADTKECARIGCGLVLVANRVPAPRDKVRGGTVCVCSCGRWYCYDCYGLQTREPKLSIAKVCSCGKEELR